ncbi:hypothetical protein FGIG_10175 [Fasciola gigantica]|uniref:Uncharacterized protein n=1 Tax=Fasciola gigantica TaxID=46835 RepID=A0A504Y7U3_FASGI|nr:hypothetical protein FGIG_10175 [Fasciola gigantica]
MKSKYSPNGVLHTECLPSGSVTSSKEIDVFGNVPLKSTGNRWEPSRMSLVREVHSGSCHHIRPPSALDMLPFDVQMEQTSSIKVQLLADGLYSFESSQKQVWTIFGGAIYPSMSTPFLMGVYSSLKQPKEMKGSLEDFTGDLLKFLCQGIRFKEADDDTQVLPKAVTCDHHARAFAKCKESHADHLSCDKRAQQGVKHENTVAYPSVGNRLPTRSSFRRDRIKESPLQMLNIDTVKDFQIDYMRSINLSVMRKFIFLLTNPSKSIGFRLLKKQIKAGNDNLVSLRSQLTRELRRTLCSNDVLIINLHYDLLRLSISPSILSGAKSPKNVQLAQGLLASYVRTHRVGFGVGKKKENREYHSQNDTMRKWAAKFCPTRSTFSLLVTIIIRRHRCAFSGNEHLNPQA